MREHRVDREAEPVPKVQRVRATQPMTVRGEEVRERAWLAIEEVMEHVAPIEEEADRIGK